MYRWIKAMQEPFEFGVDEQGRAIYKFNIIAEKAPSSTFLREIAKVLYAAGVGSYGTTLFADRKALIPPKGTVVIIGSTGGAAPLLTQNRAGVSAQRPTADIFVHAEKSEDALAKAYAAYNALTVVKNENLTAA